MSTDALLIFNAALNLPVSARADLAAQLIASLDASVALAPARSAAEWSELLHERSDAMHRGEATLVSGEEALSRMRSAVEQAGRTE